MKVCFWATSFQADTQALAYHLAEQPGVQVMVALDQPEAYAREAIHRVVPFHGRLLERGAASTRVELARFAADLVVIDNHVPPHRIAPRMLVMWHGYGWRVDDLSQMRKELRKQIGDVTRPNPNFRWQAFGEWDRRYRVEHSRLAPENVVALGSAYSDWLRPDGALRRGFVRSAVQDHYSIDLSRPTLLLALTWHHGGSLAHWGPEEGLLARLLEHAGTRGANVLIRMHDRHRYESEYTALIERVARRHGHVQLKWKSSAPDSLVDLLVSDAMISNYSSILNGYYHSGRPTVHVDPADARGGAAYYRRWKSGRLHKERVADAQSLWKLPPSEIGGLRARSFEELIGCVDRALDDPSCCVEAARAFNARHVTGADGRTRVRITELLRAWCTATP
jgi:hypothetical protein